MQHDCLSLPYALWLHKHGLPSQVAGGSTQERLQHLREWVARKCDDDAVLLLDELSHPEKDSWGRPSASCLLSFWPCLSWVAADDGCSTVAALQIACIGNINADRLAAWVPSQSPLSFDRSAALLAVPVLQTEQWQHIVFLKLDGHHLK